MNKIPVMIRVEGKRKPASAHLNDIVAIFPAEAGTDDPSTCLCYAHVGQHGACSSDYAGRKTRPATPDEIERMLRELVATGYKREELHVVARSSSHHAKARREQCKR